MCSPRRVPMFWLRSCRVRTRWRCVRRVRPGLRPLLEVNAVSTRDGSPTREELAGHEDLSALFDPGVVLNHQENFWDAATEA